MNEVLEMEVDTENSYLKDTPKPTKEGHVKWLEDFRTTHYPNRPLTNQFWATVIWSRHFGIDVKEVLGEKIITNVQQYDPKRFKNVFK